MTASEVLTTPLIFNYRLLKHLLNDLWPCVRTAPPVSADPTPQTWLWPVCTSTWWGPECPSSPPEESPATSSLTWNIAGPMRKKNESAKLNIPARKQHLYRGMNEKSVTEWQFDPWWTTIKAHQSWSIELSLDTEQLRYFKEAVVWKAFRLKGNLVWDEPLKCLLEWEFKL